jgi:general secretion pathway protein M
MSAGALPEGRTGQILAAALALAALAALWLGAVAPAWGWFGARQEQLAAARLELAHLIMLRTSLPDLRRAVAGSAAPAAAAMLLAGDSDAIAAANLQSAVQGLATTSGLSLDSVAMVPEEPVGALRKIGVAVSLTTTWPALVALLGAIDTAQPRMITDDLVVTASTPTDPRQDVPLEASFTVSAFRAGDGP